MRVILGWQSVPEQGVQTFSFGNQTVEGYERVRQSTSRDLWT